MAVEVRHRIREERLKAGLSQGGLADALGVDRTTISQLEREVAEPRLRTLERIATALGCGIADLLPVGTFTTG